MGVSDVLLGVAFAAFAAAGFLIGALAAGWIVGLVVVLCIVGVAAVLGSLASADGRGRP
jgi:hypothetical protein